MKTRGIKNSSCERQRVVCRIDFLRSPLQLRKDLPTFSMNHSLIKMVVAGILLFSFASWGSPDLDNHYGMRTFVGVVINGETDPVYSEVVENQIIKYFRTRTRFEVPEKAYITFKSDLATVYLNDPATPLDQKLLWIRPQILKLKPLGVDAVVVAEIGRTAESYHLNFVLTDTTDMMFVRTKEVNVDDPNSQDSFASAVNSGLDSLVSHIPFDGTVVKRDGYRVVLDRGVPDLMVGQEISTYTLEKSPDKANDKLFLKETGRVKITEVGDTLSFGQILVEKKPLEVLTGNKFLVAQSEVRRDIAFSEMEVPVRHGEYGDLELKVGFASANLDTHASSGAGLSQGKTYPEGSIRGKLWLTSHSFLDIQLGIGLATLTGSSTGTPNSLNSTMDDMRFLAGYQFGLSDSSAGPKMFVRGGYSVHKISVDPSADPYAFTSANYSGLLVGAGAIFGLFKKVAISFDVDGLLIGSMSEPGLTSGSSISDVLGWDFGIQGIYKLNDRFDLFARLAFESYSAAFSGQGTKPIPLASSSENSSGINLGMAYSF